MKTVMFIMLCVFFATGTVRAIEPDYIISDGKVYIVEKVRISPFLSIHGKNEDGSVRFKAKDVEGYRKAGVVYHRLPEYVDNRPTGREVFMQGLALRNGYIIYCQTLPGANRLAHNNYFVFKGRDYFLKLDPSTSEQLTNFFSYRD